MYSGFLIVDKPAGITSHDVVSAVRRLAGLKKVGHTGTLDPFATGVLPVALGEGTKVIPFLDESVKEYRAVMCVGTTTDTQDNTGTALLQRSWQHLTSAVIDETFRTFVGKGRQVPPMYSAIKRNGVPLYKLARKGEEVYREPRDIEIHSLQIESVDLPLVTFTVRSSRGLYVRTLASDIGERLGCGAHLVELRRNASGMFLIQQAVSLETLVTSAGEGAFVDHLIPCCTSLNNLQALNLTHTGGMRVRNGISPTVEDFQAFPQRSLGPGERVRLCCGDAFLAVAENGPGTWPDNGNSLRLLRVFNEH